jgi:hypothetical protein
MFKSCCARPNKKISKSKSKSEKIDAMADASEVATEEKLHDSKETDNKQAEDPKEVKMLKTNNADSVKEDSDSQPNIEHSEQIKIALDDSTNDPTDEDTIDRIAFRKDLSKKRFSVDYKKTRLDFKRFSVDCRRDSATLEELARLEQELARTNVDVRPGIRRKSSGILKSTTSSNNGNVEQRIINKQESCSDDDDEVFEGTASPSYAMEGTQEPPATPVGRDELALRRHRFFSDLVCAARAAVEHRVRFDPLGPVVADSGIV